jgi:hypothetical protein
VKGVESFLGVEETPKGCEVLLSMPHPQNARFLQYDALDDKTRAIIRKKGKYMQLLDCTAQSF